MWQAEFQLPTQRASSHPHRARNPTASRSTEQQVPGSPQPRPVIRAERSPDVLPRAPPPGAGAHYRTTGLGGSCAPAATSRAGHPCSWSRSPFVQARYGAKGHVILPGPKPPVSTYQPPATNHPSPPANPQPHFNPETIRYRPSNNLLRNQRAQTAEPRAVVPASRNMMTI